MPLQHSGETVASPVQGLPLAAMAATAGSSAGMVETAAALAQGIPATPTVVASSPRAAAFSAAGVSRREETEASASLDPLLAVMVAMAAWAGMVVAVATLSQATLVMPMAALSSRLAMES